MKLGAGTPAPSSRPGTRPAALSGLGPTNRQVARAPAIVTRRAVDAMNDEPTPNHFARRVHLFVASRAEGILILRIQAAALGSAHSNFHLLAGAIL